MMPDPKGAPTLPAGTVANADPAPLPAAAAATTAPGAAPPPAPRAPADPKGATDKAALDRGVAGLK
jgi:hypothetical protein